MYQFKFFLTEKEYLDFHIFHFTTAPSYKKLLWMMRLIIPALSAAMILVNVLSADDPALTPEENRAGVIGFAVILSSLSIAWFFLAKPLWFSAIKRQLRRAKKDGKLPYDKEVLLQFDDEFITETIDGTETKTRYASIDKIAFGSDAIYLYFSAVQAYLVPASVFYTKDQKQAFLAFLESKIEAAKESVCTQNKT